MAHLQGYRHDVFVSYAHAPQLSDWSQKLCESLASALNYLLGYNTTQPGVDIWMDPDLRRNLPLTAQLRSRIEESALLLIVMSRFYLSSEWCGKEVAWFEAAARSRVAPRSRIFIVHPEPTDRAKWPSALHDLPGYTFHSDTRSARVVLPFGFIGNEEDKASFEAARWNVAQQIKLQMDELLAPAVEPPEVQPTAVSTSGRAARLIFLDGSAVSIESDSVGQTIRNILRAAQAETFEADAWGPVPRTPDDANQLFAKLVRAKAGCDGLLFVQRDSSDALREWLLDYLSEVVPAARRIRPDGSPPMPAVVDTTDTDAPLVFGGVPILKYHRPDFSTLLSTWVQGLAKARGAA